MSDSTRSGDDSKGQSRPRYVPAPGASDPSKGMVPDESHPPAEPTNYKSRRSDPDVEYREYSTRQPARASGLSHPGRVISPKAWSGSRSDLAVNRCSTGGRGGSAARRLMADQRCTRFCGGAGFFKVGWL